MSKLTYQDKVKLYDKPSVPEINKVTDANINNIKHAVNEATNYNAVTEDSAGKLKCNLTGTLATGDIVPISIPTLTNTSAKMQISIDNGAHYYYIKQMSDDAVFNDYSNTEISASKCTLYFDGTQFILDKSKFGGKIITNSNTIVRNGSYTALGTATGVPNNSYSWFIRHENSNTGNVSAYQRAVAYSTNLIIYERTKINGTWGNWVNSDNGWKAAGETWTYSSVDNPTGVITISGDKTTKYSLGMKIKFTNNSNIIYGIITAISYSSPNTTLTFLHEINTSTSQALHLITNSAITENYYSIVKTPYGFPIEKAKWTVTFTDTKQRVQTSPVAGTWYNLGSLSTNLPIGAWDVNYKIWGYFGRASTGASSLFTCISTTNNGASNEKYVTSSAGYGTGTASFGFTSVRCVSITVTTKTTFYFNCMTLDSATYIFFNNNESALLFEAVCAYL